MQNKYEKLVKNTAIFAIGNFASKILNFLIVPLYTYVLTTEEYGTIDLIATTISFLIPVLTLQIQEALLRFALGGEKRLETCVSNSWLVFIIGSIISMLFYPAYYLLFKSKLYALVLVLLLICNIFNTIFPYYLRAVGKNVVFTINGILGTISFLTSNIIFLLVLKVGMWGYMFALLISQIVMVVYTIFAGDLFNKLNLKYYDKDTLKQMLLFSIPLIPNSLMWWIMSAGDKYIINWFLGTSANGIYSMSLKVPTILSMFFSIFFQAWQMSAIEEMNSDNKKNFYETVYKITFGLISILTVGITWLVKPLFLTVLGNSFKISWRYVPILDLGIMFSCLSSFFSVVYTTTSKTNKAFYTTVLGAVLNLFFNFIFVRSFGLQGIALGSCLGYVIIAIIRALDMYKDMHIDLDLKRSVCIILILLIQIVCTISGSLLYFLTGIISVVLLLCFYRKEIFYILKKIKQKFSI